MHINLEGLNTQTAPVDAIAEIVEDVKGGFVNPLTALNYIEAIIIEWRQ